MLSDLSTFAKVHSGGGHYRHTAVSTSAVSQIVKKPRASSSFFPDDFAVARQEVLQLCDAGELRRVCCLELHVATLRGRRYFRVYRRSASAVSAGVVPQPAELWVKERLRDAAKLLSKLYDELVLKHGYEPAFVASSPLGAHAAAPSPPAGAAAAPLGAGLSAPPDVVALSEHLYAAARGAAVETLGARVTERGVESRVGVLGLAAVEKGLALLKQLYDAWGAGDATRDADAYDALAAELAAAVPLPASLITGGAPGAPPALRTRAAFAEAQEALSLMHDMVAVNEDTVHGGGPAAADARLRALNLDTFAVATADERTALQNLITGGGGGGASAVQQPRLLNAYRVGRSSEAGSFDPRGVGNARLLFHGSKPSSFVGLLSRGLLLPQVVSAMGGGRTDEGFLGLGIYLAPNLADAARYAPPAAAAGRRTRLALVVEAALGKSAQFTKKQPQLRAPPPGYDSCEGLGPADAGGKPTQFLHSEFVLYEKAQLRVKYIVEFSMPGDLPAAAAEPSAAAAAGPAAESPPSRPMLTASG